MSTGTDVDPETLLKLLKEIRGKFPKNPKPDGNDGDTTLENYRKCIEDAKKSMKNVKVEEPQPLRCIDDGTERSKQMTKLQIELLTLKIEIMKIEKKIVEMKYELKKDDYMKQLQCFADIQNGLTEIYKKINEWENSLRFTTEKKKEIWELKDFTWHSIEALEILLIIAAIALIFSSNDALNAQPCELKTALNYIYMEHTPNPCKHYQIEKNSTMLLIWGSVELVLNVILCALTMLARLIGSDKKALLCAGISITVVTFIVSLALYIVFSIQKEEETSFDSLQLQSSMMSWLENNYKSDNISSGDRISTAWNVFFIKYDCCAVSDVTGTTNDFDNTPWCTTSGSCQATASQIPKTCCKGVTQDDYQNAPSTCHASVNSGTYKSSCLSQMKTLSRENINESTVFVMYLSFSALVILKVLLFFLGLFNICYFRKNRVVQGQT